MATPAHRPPRVLFHWYPSLSISAYRRLWFGLVPYHFAYQFGIVATGIAAVRLSDSAAVVGLLVGAWGLPVLVLPPLGGVVADRVPRTRILVAAQVVLGTGALVLGLSALAGALTPWLLLVVGLAQGSTFAFFVPARVAWTADVVDRELVPNALAAYSLSDYASGVLGPVIAGGLLSAAAFGLGETYLAIAGLYLVVLVVFATLPPGTRPEPDLTRSTWRQIADAVSYVRRTPPLTAILGLSAAATLLGMPLLLLMPVFADRVFDVGAAGLGTLLAAAGAGTIGGVLAASRVRGERHIGRAQALAGVGLGAAIVAFASSPGYVVALVAAALAGLATSAFAVLNYARLLMYVRPGLTGRVASLYQLTFALGPIGAAPMGAIADVVGPRTAVGAGGVVLAAVVVALLRTELRGRQPDRYAHTQEEEPA